VREFDAEFVAGFVGLSQDPITLSVKPEIGWLVKEGRKDASTTPDALKMLINSFRHCRVKSFK
jgi:hypothetical protein